MRNKIVILLLLIANTMFAVPAITYAFSGGRFGDNLLAYLHAKWLSYQYQIPLLYKPFPYSSELVMDEREILYSAVRGNYKRDIRLNKRCSTPKGDLDIFTCPYFPEIEWELRNGCYFTFPIDWKNQEFRTLALEMIAPKRDLQLIWPPKGQLSIAIHMREGGGFDDEGHKLKHPLKTPPVTFYSESLKKVVELLPNREFYCHVFTDAVNPQEWIDKMVQYLPSEFPIVFNYRKEDNKHDLNVLNDFFSLFNFDILIRAESNYSIIPSLLQDYLVLCYPKEYSIRNKVVTIDEIKVIVNKEKIRSLF